MTARLWIDLTGVAPGSDAAILAQRLAPALRVRLGDTVGLCRRDPGLRECGWEELTALSARAVDRAVRPPGLRARIEHAAGFLPQRTRTAIRRAMALQFAAARALRPPPPRPAPPAAAAVDTLHPSAGDSLLMLLPRGDATRFHAGGIRLAALMPGRAGLDRPDLLAEGAASEAALWAATTRAHALPIELQAAGWRTAPLTTGLPPPGFVLADGEIGLPGQTHLLLLAWRRLLENWRGDQQPHLVLAGRIGPLAGDVLAQLRNSDDFAGSVTLFGDPTEAERAGLRNACRFTLALEPLAQWGRATLDGLAAGRPCLSAFAAPEAAWLEPGNATALSDRMAGWLADPPPAPTPSSRSWDDVAGDLIAALRA